MKKIRTIIVDDHEIFRTGLKLLLSKVENVKVVAEASNGQELMEVIKKHEADLAFMDINMPILDGIEATEQVLSKYPNLKIIALTTFCDSEHFNKMIYAGVEGFMLKNSTLDDFRRAIEKVSQGGNYFSEEMLVKCTKNFVLQQTGEKEKMKIAELSTREIEVLELICKGYSNAKIGEKLFISDRTVERHKTNLISKTETKNTVNLVIYAFKNKLIEL
ncbi:MAG: response regulator transcription factor [Saprospiraceae bacterium]|nr:response regulator transcription factor [Saprospiraceae bacterium]